MDSDGRGRVPDLAVVTTLLVGSASAIKVFAASHWDVVTVSGLLSYRGFSGIAVLVLIVGLPIFSTLLFLSGAVDLMEGVREEDPLIGPVVSFTAGIVGAFCFAPREYFVGLSALAILAVGSSLWIRHKRKSREKNGEPPGLLLGANPQRRPVAVLLAVSVSLGMAYLVFNDDVWLPQESVLISSGRGEPAESLGYVLAEGGEFTPLMSHGERRIELVRTARIESRRLCASGYGGRSWLADLIWPGETVYAKC